MINKDPNLFRHSCLLLFVGFAIGRLWLWVGSVAFCLRGAIIQFIGNIQKHKFIFLANSLKSAIRITDHPACPSALPYNTKYNVCWSWSWRIDCDDQPKYKVHTSSTKLY